MKRLSLLVEGRLRGLTGWRGGKSRAADRGALLIAVIIGVPVATAIVLGGFGFI